MGKIRIYQVAKELGVDNKELISRVSALGIDVRNYMSTLEAEDVARVKREFDKQRHEQMVEEQIKPGVTRRRSVAPRTSARPAPAPAPPFSVAGQPAAAVKRRSTAKTARPGPAVPPPPESAVLPSARPAAVGEPLEPATLHGAPRPRR